MEKRFVFLLAVILVSMIFVATARAGSVTNYKFTGKELDGETNFEYFGARYFDQDKARFISVDPLTLTPTELQKLLSDPQQLNGYAYARNNPLRFIDDTGKKVSEFQPYLPKTQTYEYHEAIGSYRGIPIVSHGVVPATSSTNNYQCTTFVTTFAQQQYGFNLRGMGDAMNYGNQARLTEISRENNKQSVHAYTAYSNGSSVMPQENDIVSWSGGYYGHVGIIAEVSFDDVSGSGTVYTVEQNFDRGRALFSQPLTRTYDTQGIVHYSIGSRGSYRVQSWDRYDNQTTMYGPRVYSRYTPAPKNFVSRN